MKAVILAGGKGVRFSEETTLKPKPLIEVGGMPILWHIMKIYSRYGINDFIILCGYRGSMIKEYFSNYSLYTADVTFDMGRHTKEILKNGAEPWKVTLIDTQLETMTGGRLKRAKEFVGGETFCFTYGDGLSDVNIERVIDRHRKNGTVATVTAMRHSSRFGLLDIHGEKVTKFSEKPLGESDWMNSGFFVLEPAIFDEIEGDRTVFEQEPLHRLVEKGQLTAYCHDGFFMGMDSLRERMVLEELWASGKAPWKVW